jgi:DNA-binding CsgD family transcriptional regulator
MARTRRQLDLIGIVEAAYHIDLSTAEWLAGICAAAAPVIDSGFGVAAYSYDASDPNGFRLTSSLAYQGMPDGFPFVESLTNLDIGFVRKSYRARSCSTGSEVAGFHELPFLGMYADRFGVRDTLVVNGINPDGHGCAVQALLPKETKLGSRRKDLLTKLSCHLAAALRLRNRLATADAQSSSPEAILDCGGKVCHAEGDARSKSALSQLRVSALAISKARGSLRAREPEQAVEEWKGLIAARWTLLDVSESDGRKYLVARENQPRLLGPNSLTDREQQVVAFAVLGLHNKLIAYNLGISHSTVRVLIARAAGKLQAHSRQELLRRYTKVVQATP